MFDNFPGKTINKILTLLSAVILFAWFWRWFGPGSATLRAAASASGAGKRLSLFEMFKISLLVVSLGYLLWRAMIYLYWYKYFKK